MSLTRSHVGPYAHGETLEEDACTHWDDMIERALDKSSAGDYLDGYVIVRAPTGALAFAAGADCLFGAGSLLQFEGNSTISTSGALVTATLSFDANSSIETDGSITTSELTATTATITDLSVSEDAVIESLQASEIIIDSGSEIRPETPLSMTRVFMPSRCTPAASWTIEDFAYVSETETADDFVIFDLNLPDNCEITEVRIYFLPVFTHTGFDLTLPQMKFGYVTASSGVATTLSTANDTSATEAEYETYHYLTTGAISHTVVRSGRAYSASFRNEHGTNGATGLRVKACHVSYTLNNFDLTS